MNICTKLHGSSFKMKGKGCTNCAMLPSLVVLLCTELAHQRDAHCVCVFGVAVRYRTVPLCIVK